MKGALSELPDGWLHRPLKFVASYNDEVLSEKTDPEKEIEYIEISDVSLIEGVKRTSNMEFDGAPSRARRIVRSNDILISTVRTYLKAISNVSDAPHNLIASTGFCVVRPSKKVDPKFLGWVAKSEPFVGEVVSRSVGVSYPAINAGDLVGIDVPVPPIEIQEKIAAFLDEKTAQIDGLIEKKRALLERLAEKRQALITQAVTKGLTPNAPMKDSGIDWLGQVPAHWEVKLVKHVAKLESGHTPSRQHDEYWEDTNDIPWVSLNDTALLRKSDYISDTTFKINELGLANSSARMLPERAVVFTRDATIGECAITTKSMAVSQHIIAWLCDHEMLIPEYLLFSLYGMKGELLRLTNGSTIGTIGLSDVKSLGLVVPPIVEQEAIVSHVLGAKEDIDSCASDIAKSIEKLEEYRAALISSAVTGKIEGLQ